MDNGWLIVLLLAVIGIIVGNLLLLKHSAKLGFKKTDGQPKRDNNAAFDKDDEW